MSEMEGWREAAAIGPTNQFGQFSIRFFSVRRNAGTTNHLWGPTRLSTLDWNLVLQHKHLGRQIAVLYQVYSAEYVDICGLNNLQEIFSGQA